MFVGLQALYKVFGAEITDMESPAIMHVCASNNIDCLVIRSVSDLAGGKAPILALFSLFLQGEGEGYESPRSVRIQPWQAEDIAVRVN